MFKMFNPPVLDDAVNVEKYILFSHNLTTYGECILKQEWDYLCILCIEKSYKLV